MSRHSVQTKSGDQKWASLLVGNMAVSTAESRLALGQYGSGGFGCIGLSCSRASLRISVFISVGRFWKVAILFRELDLASVCCSVVVVL